MSNLTGEPLSGATVSAARYYRTMVDALLNDSPAIEPVITGPDGRFRFPAMEQGSYMLTVDRDGFISQRAGPEAGEQGPLVVVSPDRNEELVVRLNRKATLAGYVRDAEGRPVAEAPVVLLTPEGFRFKPVASTVTGVDGAFSIEGLRWGQYVLSGGFPLPDDPARLQVGSFLIQVTASESSETLNISTVARGYRISGDLQDLRQDKTAPFTLSIRSRYPDSWTTPLAGGTLGVRTSDERFEFRDLSPGIYSISASEGPCGATEVPVFDEDVRSPDLVFVECRLQ